MWRMGEYAYYVWSAYAAVLIGLCVITWHAFLQAKRIRRSIHSRNKL